MKEPISPAPFPAEVRRRCVADLPRREALACSPDELVATSWEWSPKGPTQG
jgi:hypothetical protein